MTDWKARIAAAQAARDAAQAKITPEDRDEQAAREELARLNGERRTAEKERRRLDLDRREDAARDTLGPKAQLRQHDAEEDAPGAGTFILRYPGPKAVEEWQKALNRGAQTNKHDNTELNRNFAAASVYDWNGHTDLHGLASAHGGELLEVLKELPLVATSIVNIVGELGGLAMKGRKR